MEKLRVQGLIISAIPFQDYDRIMTVLSADEGLLKFIFKGGARLNNVSLTSPFSVVELIYSRGRSELLKCYEASVLDHNLALRNNLTTLEAAFDLLQAVSATQMPGKSCPVLYQLLLTYLKKMPTAYDPRTLSASFRLKILRHEGLWRNFSNCISCNSQCSDSYILGGNTYCKLHSPQQAMEISLSEKEILELLAFSRDLPLLASLPMTQELSKKIKFLFDDSFLS